MQLRQEKPHCSRCCLLPRRSLDNAGRDTARWHGEGYQTPRATSPQEPLRNELFKQQKQTPVFLWIAQSQLKHNYLIVKDHASARHCLH